MKKSSHLVVIQSQYDVAHENGVFFQDENESLEEDGDGANICSSRGVDSWLDSHNHWKKGKDKTPSTIYERI